MEQFRFELTDGEKAYLKALVRGCIGQAFDPPGEWDIPEPPTDKLRQPFGAFVTLTLGGELRGCIGSLQGDKPLYLTIADMAHAAAFKDPRFPPVSGEECPRLEVEVSILGPITPCPDPENVEIGRHGLIVRQGYRQGLLLPQVAVDWKWDRETFLSQTCRKACLPPDAWKLPETEIFWFEAEVF
ncbi:MAG: AmmeMemoRadiSam system protein A [Thermodesulfobacteriota bacterium]